MKVQWAVPVIASILILGTMSVQQVFAPDEQPEKLTLGGAGYNDDSSEFEIKVLVHLPKGSDFASFTVDTTLEFFKPDSTPIRVSGSDPVPAGVKEGGNNSSVHKLIAKIPYDPPEDLLGEKIQVVVTSELLDPDGNSVDQTIKKTWKKFAKSFR